MNKKGFTLMELLTIIVILGIILIIAIPKIAETIDKSRKNASQISAINYIKAIDTFYLNQKMNQQPIILDGSYTITQSGALTNNTNTYQISFTGKGIQSGTLIYDNQELQSGCLMVNNYKITIDENYNATVENGNC